MTVNCNICGKEFPNKKSMTSHRRWHDLPEYKEFQKSYKNKMSKILQGRTYSKETLNKMSESKKGLLVGERNGNWKGDNVGYHCLHAWVRRHKPKPDACEKCGKITEKLECANISGEYKRDLNDYMYMCFKCHMLFDNRWENFMEAGKATRFKKGHPPSNRKPNRGVMDH